MSKEQQPESLRLADNLAANRCHRAAAELRRLHAENEALKRELIKESAHTAAEKRRADQMSLQHSMQAAVNREAREKLARYAASEIADQASKGVCDGNR